MNINVGSNNEYLTLVGASSNRKEYLRLSLLRGLMRDCVFS